MSHTLKPLQNTSQLYTSKISHTLKSVQNTAKITLVTFNLNKAVRNTVQFSLQYSAVHQIVKDALLQTTVKGQ